MGIPENKWARAALPALLIHCSIGTVYCWSSFSGALAAQLGTKPEALGWAFSLAIFCLGMAATFAGPLVERDIHKASLAAFLLFSAGLAGTGLCVQFAKTLGAGAASAGVFLFYGAVMGAGVGIGYLCPVKTLMLWFQDNKGLATGIAIMGFGLAKAIASPLINALQQRLALHSIFYCMAVGYGALMLLGHLLLRKPAGWVEAAGAKATAATKEALGSKTFLGIWLLFYMNITCGLALISYEKPLLQLAGLSAGAVSGWQAATALANALGRLGFSAAGDRCKNRGDIYRAIFLLSALAAGTGFAFDGAAGRGAVLVGVVLLVVNAGYGGGFSTLPALLASRFGMEQISRLHGLSLSAWALAGLSGNQLAAFVLRRGGSYANLLLVLTVLYAAGFALSLWLLRPSACSSVAPASASVSSPAVPNFKVQ